MAGVMKDSEVEWIGEIPEGWDISKVKYIGRYINGYAFKPDQWGQDGLPIIRIQNLSGSSESINYFDGKISDDYLIDDGDILISWSATLDAFIWNYGKGWLNQHIFKAIPNVQKTHKNYFFHLMKIAMLNMSSDKHGSAMQHVTNQIFGNFQVPLPSLSEQKLIADFLDEKCAEIDKLSDDIQKQIDILNDYKKSVITRAVTKGLDPNAEMKDSGIKWIGDIPKNWTSKKVKYYLFRDEKRNPGEMPILSVYREYGVIPKNSRDDNHNVTSEDTSKYKYVRPGYLVINKMKAWQGSMGVSDYEGVVSPAYFIYRLKSKDILPEYIHHLLRSCYKDEFRRISGGIREGQWDLPAIGFENTPICIPSIDEQKSILNFIDSIVPQIEESVSVKAEQILRLLEYKKSIIYEYVTGKKRVKGAL
jgi:restriction modification system DNA specificity domain protein